MKLYEITQEFNNLIDFETGEILDPKGLEALQVEEKEKLRNCFYYIQNQKADSAVLAEEIKRLQDRKKTATNIINSLRDYILHHLQSRDMQKYKDELFSFTVSERSTVEILDPASLPKKYLKTVKVVEIDKKAIEQALKEGKKVKGATLSKKPVLTIR